MSYKLDSYVATYEKLKDLSYKQIKADKDLFMEFITFVSHCFAGYSDSVLADSCTVCEQNHLRRLKTDGLQEAIKADKLNSKPYRLKNSVLRSAFWTQGGQVIKSGFNLSDENVNELIVNGTFNPDHFEFYPAEWFSGQEQEQEPKPSRKKKGAE